jgi:hypothetical protein
MYARNALALIQPTRFIEPFGGSVVEAALCGTPGIVADQGGMTETVIQGVTGFRCKTLGDYLYAIEHVDRLDRAAIGKHARMKYTLDATRPLYIRAIETLHELCSGGGLGWNSPRAFSFSDEIVRMPSQRQQVEAPKPDAIQLKVIQRLVDKLKEAEEKIKQLTLRPMRGPKTAVEDPFDDEGERVMPPIRPRGGIRQQARDLALKHFPNLINPTEEK